MKKITSFLILFLIINSVVYSQTRAKKKAKEEIIDQNFRTIINLIESNNFKFEASSATPLGNDISKIGLSLSGGGSVFQGGRVDLTSNDNYVLIKDETADLFLPYFGRVFLPSRNSNDRGINYKGKLKNYSVSINEKKKRIIVNFEADKKGDYLKFAFTINASGNSNLSIYSTKRQSISYTGNITALTIK